jgi:UDP-GlcNAc:undecaprenyl-phosphate/decaprenyl-phosphate GlcNAc-1-phosphate transferase
MFAAFTLAALAYTAAASAWDQVPWGLLAGVGLMFALGLVDDFRHLKPPTKLVIQFTAAAITISFGYVIDFFPWTLANVILTFSWLVGISNAINLLDNMDGLAGGIALIAASFLAYFFWLGGSQILLALTLALVGSIMGFLIYNFPPAKIFMGDSGSMFLGFTLAALAVAHRPRASDVFSVMGVPILLFLLPIIDTGLVTFTRILRGQSPAQGGADHTSHRLIAFGLSERQTVVSLYAIAILSGVAGVVLESLDYDLSLFLIPALLIALSLLTAYLSRIKVVTSYKSNEGSISRLVADLTYRRRVFEIILDFFIIGLAFYLAFWVWYGFHLEGENMDMVITRMPVALAGAYLAFYIGGVYRGLWQYMGLDDLVRYGRAAFGGVILAAPLIWFFSRSVSVPGPVYLLYGIFLFLGLAVSRASFRLLDSAYGRRQLDKKKMVILIYGAGDAGEITLQWLQRNPLLGYEPVGFIDNDPFKWGRRIHGVNVLGGPDQFVDILDNTQADGLILTSPDLFENAPARQVLHVCQRRGVWVRALKLDFVPVEERA